MPRSGGSRASWGGAGALTLNTSAVPPSTAAATPSSAPVFSPLERGAGMSLGLHRAVATGNTALALHALETGQSPQSLLHGVAPLHVAAATGDVLAIQLLLYYGADANVPRHRSRQPGPGVEASTPLHFAAANGQLAAARILLENGARPNATDRDGQTPEALAKARGFTQCATLLHDWSGSHTQSVRELGYIPQQAWGDAMERVGIPTSPPQPDAQRSPTLPIPLDPAAQSLNPTPQPLDAALQPLDAAPQPLDAAPQHMSPDALSSASPPAGAASHNSPSPPLDSARESWRLPSLPNLFEKATHPAAVLRAALLSHQGAAAAEQRKELPTGEEPAALLARLGNRRSFTGLLRRSRGVTPQPTEEPAPRMPGELLDLTEDVPESPSASSATGSKPAGLLSPPAISAPPPPQTSARSERALPLRLRSSSVSSGRQEAQWDERSERPAPTQATRARANSEVQQYRLGSLLRSLRPSGALLSAEDRSAGSGSDTGGRSAWTSPGPTEEPLSPPARDSARTSPRSTGTPPAGGPTESE